MGASLIITSDLLKIPLDHCIRCEILWLYTLLLWSLSCLPTCSPGLIFTIPELMIVGMTERRTKMVLVNFILLPSSFNEVCFTGIKFGVCANGVWCIWREWCSDCLYYIALELKKSLFHSVNLSSSDAQTSTFQWTFFDGWSCPKGLRRSHYSQSDTLDRSQTFCTISHLHAKTHKQRADV